MPARSSSPPPPPDARDAFAYALLRVVPRVERGERVNVGVVLFCRARDFLDVRVEIEDDRLLALAPDLDLDAVRMQLDFIRLVCAGDRAGGPVARLPQAERFGWVVSPTSTIVQPGRVHPGVCADPAGALDRLLSTMVRVGGGERPRGDGEGGGGA
jgi:hypothetical protein